MKKVLTIGLAFSLVVAPLTVSAQTSDEQLTKDHVVNWNNVWEEVDQNQPSQEIDFGSTVDPSSIGVKKWGELSTGKTAMSKNLLKFTATSTGTSKGKVLTTTTSATTSVRDNNSGKTTNGPKKMAVAKFTAESTASRNYTMGTANSFTGVTIHTATHDGILYDARTSDGILTY
ncbi:hypothetical protein [Oceanobacillus kimchii]|uniref:hypothetical protein n=1 Tax=Oceanobacillus kimchii TaxID=746691 RepID=UPI003C78B078